jgi:hypothetical protein
VEQIVVIVTKFILIAGLSYQQLQLWIGDDALHKMVFAESAQNPGNFR